MRFGTDRADGLNLSSRTHKKAMPLTARANLELRTGISLRGVSGGGALASPQMSLAALRSQQARFPGLRAGHTLAKLRLAI